VITKKTVIIPSTQNTENVKTTTTTIPKRPIVMPLKKEDEILRRANSYTEIPIHREKVFVGTKEPMKKQNFVDRTEIRVHPDLYKPKRTSSYLVPKLTDQINVRPKS